MLKMKFLRIEKKQNQLTKGKIAFPFNERSEKKLFCSCLSVFFIKFLYSTCRIDKLLLSGKKRMAV